MKTFIYMMDSENPIIELKIKAITRNEADRLFSIMTQLDKNDIQKVIEVQIEMGSITDEEIDAFGKFDKDEKRIIKREYKKHPKGFFPNPACALR